jgi:SNF2-related domain/SNF2 Helicase protein/Helicase conserved C-terminal domain
MTHITPELHAAVWAVADGRASAADLTTFQADPDAAVFVLDQLIDETEDDLDAVSALPGPERDQVVADFEDTLDSLWAVRDRLRPPPPPQPRAAQNARGQAAEVVDETPGEVRLQASWSDGQLVVWAAGRHVEPEGNDALADRLEAIGGPSLGWTVHQPIALPSGMKAESLAIPVKDALGWLVAVAGGLGSDGVGQSVLWLARLAVEGARLVAKGTVVPSLRFEKKAADRRADAEVRWGAALLDDGLVRELAAAMPGPVGAVVSSDARKTTIAVLSAVVDAIVTDAATRVQLPAAPLVTNTIADLAEAFVARLDGASFDAPTAAAGDISWRLDQWSRSVTTVNRPKIIVQLAPPDSGGAWLLSLFGATPKTKLAPIGEALADDKGGAIANELARLERVFPLLLRVSGVRRGQVVLSQTEAWELMTVTGPMLESVGYEVRVPELSRRKPTPSLRLFSEISGDSVVGAHQLSNVHWSVLFDDVELTAAEIARLANQARPLVQSRGRWIELDRVDLQEAAAALAERANLTQLTGAEILRHSVGLEGSSLAGGITVEGSGWATDLIRRAADVSTDPVTHPEGFVGELRSYQAHALAWLGFLDVAGLGGCLALDMGLGKTPTVLAHLARTRGHGVALVVAPPAVVGNWAAEAARFAPQLRVVIHHGADRWSEAEFQAGVANADLMITTYGTAVRDVDLLARHTWDRVILDEAQAIKNSNNESSQLLRRIPARSRLALTGTPVENGLGDLWAILDFTNPGLVGSRPSFIAQMSGEGEAALRALNGILVFRRTKTEPEVAAELPDKIDELDHCTMTPEQIGLYQAVLDRLVASVSGADVGVAPKQGAILAAITALKQICNHPSAYHDDGRPLAGRSGKLARLQEIIESVFAAGERILIFTHFASWGRRLADYLTEVTGKPIACYDGSLARGARDRIVEEFQNGSGAGALVLSLKAGGTGLNLTAASHVVLYDRWWNPAVEDQARDRAWRIGQNRTVVSHRLVCPGTVDERVEEVVAGKRHIAELVLPKSSSLSDLDAKQLRVALGLRPNELLTEDDA